MKRGIFILAMALQFVFTTAKATPVISGVVAPGTVGKYNKYEVNFNLNPYVNPYDYDVINVFAEFWSPTGKYYKQYAFYYEGYNKTDSGLPTAYEILVPSGLNGWKIRFAPQEAGSWKMRITATDVGGTVMYPSSSTYISFTCTANSNKGFIEKANSRYLKYSSGDPYYPIGNSAPWFDRNVWRGPFEYGTNEVIDEMNVMDANGIDFFRFEINFLDGLNLIGWDFTTNKNYCRYYNQHDAWQLDKIMDYANTKDINVLFAMFAHSYLGDSIYAVDAWQNYHPYNFYITSGNAPLPPDSKGDAYNAYEFYSKPSIIDLQKKLIRYIVARWSYSTKLMGYELMDEADRLDVMNDPLAAPPNLNTTIISWHQTMAGFVHANDPFKHLVTTAYADLAHPTIPSVAPFLDFTQAHHYGNYADPGWVGDFEDYLFNDAQIYRNNYGKPYMIGEHCHLDYGILGNMTSGDPHLYQLHNTLWAGMHDGSMAPPSFWRFEDIRPLNALDIYQGISLYSKSLPKLSEVHVPYHTIANGLKTFYLKDVNADEIYGWVQDSNFRFENLYNNYHPYIETFSSGARPPLSSGVYTITFPVSRNGLYTVKWFNTETGVLHSTQTVGSTVNQIVISMPTALRNGKYADAGFIVEFQCNSHWNTSVLNATAPNNIRVNSPLVAFASSNQVSYIATDNRIHQMWWTGYYWQEAVLNAGAPANVRSDSDLAIDHLGKIYFIATDNRVHQYYWNGTIWQEATLNTGAPQNVRAGSSLTTDPLGKIYFIATDNRVHQYYWNGTIWQEAVLNASAPTNVRANSPLVSDPIGTIFFVATDNRVHNYYWNGTIWQEATLNGAAPANVRFDSDLATDNLGKVYFAATDNRIHQYYWNGTIWQEATLNGGAPANVRANSRLATDVTGKIYFAATDNRIHQYYWNGSIWQEATNNTNDPQNVNYGMYSDGENIYYVANESRVWSSYWGCKDLFKSEEQFEVEETSQAEELVLNIYPNPSTGEFTINWNGENRQLDLKIYNSFGQLIIEKVVVGNELKVDLKAFSKGIYFVNVLSNGKVLTKRILRE